MLTHYLDKEGITWLFNTSYSSHMGGSCERLVGVTRRILNNMLFDNKNSNLTHEVLAAFMADVRAIINSRHLVTVTADNSSTSAMTTNVLITQKYDT